MLRRWGNDGLTLIEALVGIGFSALEMESERPARTRPDAGFSLMEFLVAFASAGIILAMAMMNMGLISQRFAARGATREIHGALQKVRMQAVAENNRFHFRLLGGSNHQYEIHDDSDGDGVEDGGEVVRTYSIQASYPDATLTVPSTITFTTNGTAPASGSVTVNHPGGNSVVNVTPAGRIKIQ